MKQCTVEFLGCVTLGIAMSLVFLWPALQLFVICVVAIIAMIFILATVTVTGLIAR